MRAALAQMSEKLAARGAACQDIETFVALLDAMTEWVDVPAEAIVPHIPADADDDVVVACALAGNADFLVTYDPHFAPLGNTYEGIRISKALPFLWAVRGDQPPESDAHN